MYIKLAPFHSQSILRNLKNGKNKKTKENK